MNIYTVIEHFSMHTGQIILLAKTFKGDQGLYDLSSGNPRPTWRGGVQGHSVRSHGKGVPQHSDTLVDRLSCRIDHEPLMLIPTSRAASRLLVTGRRRHAVTPV